MNGCTRGDENGNFTFVSGVGESVNDICALAHDNLELVESFVVENKPWSDHMPITLTLNVKVRTVDNSMNLLPKHRWDDRKTDKYKENLNKELCTMKQFKNNLNLKDMIQIIISANPNSSKQVGKTQFNKENKWFNYRCHNLREKSFKALHQYHQNPTKDNKKKYLDKNKKYKEICEYSKLEYYKGIENQINLVKNNKDWWNLVKEIKNVERQTSPGIHANEFKEYFYELLNPPQTSNNIMYAEMFYSDDDLDRPINTIEIKNVLAKAKNNKAPGEDRVSYEFLKNASDRFLEELAISYNIIYETSKLDETFTNSIIFPIFKKGERDNTNNYRGIAFMNTVAKTFMSILNTRLNQWLHKHNKINEFQAGFREGYSTSDNLYNLAAIAHLKFNEKKKLYAFFVDFRAAFDKVSRKSLIYKLQCIGVSTKLSQMIKSIYSHTKFKVWNGDELSEEFETASGVKQGCVLSPTLFSVYLNDLHDYIEGGVTVGTENIRLLMYADDIVILADDINTMQSMIKKLETYCKM